MPNLSTPNFLMPNNYAPKRSAFYALVGLVFTLLEKS